MPSKEKVKAQYGRVKGAGWFPLLHKKDIMVLGQGGIGSWTSLFLSRIGCNLHLYDMDTYEEHNMTGQVVRQRSIGMNKAEAMHDTIQDFSPDCKVEVYREYKVDSPTNDIVICGFDNMAARKIAFRNWRTELEDGTEESERSDYFFQDGRLLAEQYQIFNVPGNRPDLMDKYEKEWLFEDSDVQEAECTFKQTSHCAGIIAGKMVGFLTSWISQLPVPFKHEHFVLLNLSNDENS